MAELLPTEERPVLSTYIEAYSKLNLVAYEQERQAREQFAEDDREWLSREVDRLRGEVDRLDKKCGALAVLLYGKPPADDVPDAQ